MTLRNENGMALIVTLFFAVVLYALGGIFLLRVVNESKMAKLDREATRAFYCAQAGAQAALDGVNTLINNYLLTTIASSNPSGVVSFATSKVASGDGIGWLVYAVRNNNNPVLLQDGDQAEYSDSGTAGDGTYQYTILLTEKDDPADVGVDAWDFPFSYRITSSGTSDGATRSVFVSGDFTVRVQRDNFAKYALFTNQQTTSSGSTVWFTDKTNFAGPVHTNDRMNFALNPSGTFEGTVTQKQQTARFYNNGWSVLLDAEANGTKDVPTFHSGFQRGADTITLSSSVQKKDLIDQATNKKTYHSNGIYLPSQSGALTGGIYVKGNGTVQMSVDGNDNAVYTITQGSTTNTITVDRANQQTTVQNGASSTTYVGIPDGMDDVGTLIYVDGSITSLKGTVQQDTEVTISSSDDIMITDHLRYADYTPAAGTPGDANYVPPSADGATNLLGLVSWEGDVRVTTAAPDDLDVHGTILSKSGVFQVDSYDSGSPRGTATLLGGVISDNYGAFGQFNGATGQQISGYGRNFVYDARMQMGKAPPYFPSLNTFIAFTNDITDKLVWREGE